MLKIVQLRQILVTSICLLVHSPLLGQNALDVLNHYLDTVSRGDVSKWDKIKTVCISSVGYFSTEDFKQGAYAANYNKISYFKSYKVFPDKEKQEFFSDSLYSHSTDNFYFFKDKRVIVLENMPPVQIEGNPLSIDFFPTIIKNQMKHSKKITYNGIKNILGFEDPLHEIDIETKEKENIRYLINPNTFLLEGIFSPITNTYTVLSNYKLIDGYFIPTHIAVMNDGVIYSWENYKKIIFNQPIDMAKFNYPK